MALVKCPECGREKVSDSAVSCPSCGFGVREYFLKNPEKKIPEQSVQSKSKPQKSEQPQIKPKVTASATKPICCKKCGSIYPADYDKCPTCGEKETPISNISSTNTSSTPLDSMGGINPIREPKKPMFKGGYIAGIIVGTVVFIMGIPLIKESQSVAEYSMRHGNGDPHFYGGFFILLGIAIIITTVVLFVRALSRYNLYQDDREGYIKMVREEQKKAAQQYESMKRAEEARLAALPECPICKKKNCVRRISTLNRGVSVAVTGLASSKIGKQYECTHCKHKF